MNRDAAGAVLAHALEHGGEFARRGCGGGRQLRGLAKLLEELLVGEVDPVPEALAAEKHFQRHDLYAPAVAPLRRQVGGGVGDDPEPAATRR